jgi:hypothetical protein
VGTDFLEGSACTLRIGVEKVGDPLLLSELTANEPRSDEITWDQADARFITVVRHLLGGVIAARFAILADLSDEPFEPWHPLLIWRTRSDFDGATAPFSSPGHPSSLADYGYRPWVCGHCRTETNQRLSAC